MTDHGSHFKNNMMSELSAKIFFCHENSTPYNPRANGQVESINKVLKTMLQWMVGRSKYNWHLQLFSALWAYMNIVKISTGFTLFHLVYGLEATLPIECEIFSLKLIVELLLNTTSKEE